MPGVDGLLHIADMSHTRIAKAGDVVKVGDELEVKILKLDAATKKTVAWAQTVAGRSLDRGCAHFCGG